MVALEVCNLCGGQGFVQFFHGHSEGPEDDRDTRRCPSCHGAGWLEPWLQASTGLHAWRMEEEELKAVIRQREYSE